MNEGIQRIMETSQSAETSLDSPAIASNESAFELLGAMDIVEAFTALRHELKLQVRSGRELQKALAESLQRLENRIITISTVTPEAGASESRNMAMAIAEIEESLQRAIESIVHKSATVQSESNVLKTFDDLLSHAPWIAKTFAGKWLEELRAGLAHSIAAEKLSVPNQDATNRGLELLLARVHRLMNQFGIERVNVLHQAFDADTMNAVDMVVDSSVPSAHVAQQLRPLYRWRNSTLRCAEVRIAT